MSVQPLREVVSTMPDPLNPYTLVERLICGHQREQNGTAAKRRRCAECAPEQSERAFVQAIARESEADPIASMSAFDAATYLRERAAYLDSGKWAPARAEALREWAGRLDGFRAAAVREEER